MGGGNRIFQPNLLGFCVMVADTIQMASNARKPLSKTTSLVQ